MSDAAPPRYSVVVPAYDAARTLSRTLEALLACARDCEIVVVDDASRDETREIAARYPVRLVVRSENGGASAARNSGVRSTSGKVLVFVDADVVPPRDLFDRLDAVLAARPDAAAVSGHLTDRCGAKGFFARHKHLYTVFSFRGLGEEIGTINTSLCAIRRRSLEQVGGFDTRWRAGEDNVLGAELVLLGEPVLLDRWLRMDHLKEYDLWGLLRDDFQKSYCMARYLWSKGAALPGMLVRGTGYHHPPSILASVVTAGLVLATATTAACAPGPLTLGALGLALATHVSVAAPLYAFVGRAEGVHFALRSAAVHFLEMIVGGVAVLVALAAEVTSVAPQAEVRA